MKTSDFERVSVKRSLSLQACGAGFGLALAGYALFTARGTSTLIVPAEDVALVNQQPISRSDYLAQITTLYGVDFAHATAEQRHKVLDDMIREELFVQQLFEAARQLNDGESSKPISMADGTHVLRMVRNMRPVPFDFDTAHERVLVDFRNESINHSKSGEERFLRKRANVLIADDVQ